ncbi:MAG: hypothetical protein HOV83_16750, partial [Catenulispora sp.]|nr:hypothetical protein [Catenulispora sp.]
MEHARAGVRADGGARAAAGHAGERREAGRRGRDAGGGVSEEGSVPAVVSAQLAALGPYFAVEFHDPSQKPESPWRSMAELIDDSAVLEDRVAAVRVFLASGTGQDADAVELRVAASVVHLGLVARVLSPLFALAVEYRWCGSIGATDLRWQPGLASTFPLSMSETVPDEAGVGDIVTELETAIAGFGVNRHILRGNVASALAGAGRTLAAARPDLRDRSQARLAELLAGPRLVGSGELETDGTFRRRSCCLIYRAAPER